MFFKFFSLGILSEMYKLYSSKKSTFCFSFTCDLFHTEAVARGCSVKKVFLEILQNSQESTCARVPFLIKLQARPATLLKKRFWHRCFPVNFAKFLRKLFLIEHLRWLSLFIKVNAGNGSSAYLQHIWKLWQNDCCNIFIVFSPY